MRNLLRIGQVCNLYGISLDTLRYYDHKDLLKPIVDKENGYRYYSLEHLDVLEMLLVGKYLEIPLGQMKEKIAADNIDGYLEMLIEQNQRIKEQRERLEKLSLYTEDMTKLLNEIKDFENDDTFEKVKEETLEVTIYRAELKKLFNNESTSEITGIEAFEQWFTYSVEEDGRITEDNQTVGLSILNQRVSVSTLSNYLESKLCLSGKYKQVSFWGKEKELKEYLHALCNHFNYRNASLHIKFRFALLHEDMEHEYFVEIYFCE
jgi:DNA-binding transcriptional MerR regulator